MALNLGVMNAAVALDDGDFNRKMNQLPNTAEGSFKKVAALAAGYLTFRATFALATNALTEFSALEEANNKFMNVFRRIPGTSVQVAKALQRDFGLSEQSAKDMLSATGDLLTGFDFTQEAALRLSDQAARLGADLASYTNYEGGAKGAALALTSAMLGETEKAKALGVVIRQDSEEFINLVTKYQDTEGATLMQAKAMAALTIATNQSKNAIGDWSRPGETWAQTQMKIAENTRTATAAVGEWLASAGHPLTKSYNDLLKAFGDMSPASRALLLNLTGLTAAAVLLQTKTAKGVEDGIVAVLKGVAGIGLQATAEAAAVEAAEIKKRTSYERTAARRELIDQRFAARIARGNAGSAQIEMNGAQYGLEQLRGSGAAPEQLAEAKTKLAETTMRYNKLLKVENDLTAEVPTKTKAAALAKLADERATKQLSAATDAANKAQTVGGRASLYFSGALTKLQLGLRSVYVALGPVGTAMLAWGALSAAVNFFDDRRAGAIRGAMAITEESAQASREAMEANDKLRVSYDKKMERLQALSRIDALSRNEMDEASKIIDQLTKQYGDLGMQIDSVTGKINISTDAWSRMNEEQRKAHVAKAETALAETHNATTSAEKGLEKTIESRGMSDAINPKMSMIAREKAISQGKYDPRMNIKDIAELLQGGRLSNQERLSAYGELKNRFKEEKTTEDTKSAIEDINAVVASLQKEIEIEEELARVKKGGAMIEAEAAAERQKQANIDRKTAQEKLDDAERDQKMRLGDDADKYNAIALKGQQTERERVKTRDDALAAEMKSFDDEWKRKKEQFDAMKPDSQLNAEELDQKKKLAAELDALTLKYKTYRGAIISGTQDSIDRDQTAAEIELKRQLVELDTQRAELQKSAARAFAEEQRGRSEYLGDMTADENRKAAERQINRLQATGRSPAAMLLAEQQYLQSSRAAEMLRQQYAQTVAQAQKDRIYTDDERIATSTARRNLEKAERDALNWRDRLTSMQDAERDGGRQAASTGAFSAKNLAAQIGQVNAAEETARNTRETVRLLRDLNNKDGSLSYS